MMRWWFAFLMVGIIFQFLAGCRPSDEILSDDARNPYVTSGLNYVASYEHDAAIGAFEKALETNPNSVRAHFELGLLYEKQKQDFVTAIYHYQRVLKLQSTGWPSENVRLLIDGCRQELVKNEALGPIMRTMKRNLESLQSTNALLLAEIDSLKSRLEEAQASSVATPRAPAPRTPARQPFTPSNRREPVNRQLLVDRPGPSPRPVTTYASSRVYTLKSGDTLYSVAKRYGISVSSLKAANQGIQPNNLPIGYKLRIPSR